MQYAFVRGLEVVCVNFPPSNYRNLQSEFFSIDANFIPRSKEFWQNIHRRCYVLSAPHLSRYNQNISNKIIDVYIIVNCPFGMSVSHY